jgi:hypothetical protein
MILCGVTPFSLIRMVSIFSEEKMLLKMEASMSLRNVGNHYQNTWRHFQCLMSTIRCNRHGVIFIISRDNSLPYLELDLFCCFFILVCLIFLYFMADLVLIIYVLLCNFAYPLDCNVTVGLAKFSL